VIGSHPALHIGATEIHLGGDDGLDGEAGQLGEGPGMVDSNTDLAFRAGGTGSIDFDNAASVAAGHRQRA